MQELLTGKRRLQSYSGKGYKQSKFGIIPEDWEIKPLNLLSSFISKGATPTTYGYGWEKDGVLFLRSECVSENGLDLSQSMFISQEAHYALVRGEVRSHDILMTITGNVGRVIFLSKEFGIANTNQHIARIRIIHSNTDAEYVYHYLSQPYVRKYYNSIVTGQAYPQISLTQVRDTEIPLPSSLRTNRHRRNPERHGCRNRRARRETRQSSSGQGGDDAGVVDRESEVGVSVR